MAWVDSVTDDATDRSSISQLGPAPKGLVR
jgi:hypothetical protein